MAGAQLRATTLVLLEYYLYPHAVGKPAKVQVPEAPTSSMVFLEDLPEDEQDLSGLGKYGAGGLPYSYLSNIKFCCRIAYACRWLSGRQRSVMSDKTETALIPAP